MTKIIIEKTISSDIFFHIGTFLFSLGFIASLQLIYDLPPYMWFLWYGGVILIRYLSEWRLKIKR